MGSKAEGSPLSVSQQSVIGSGLVIYSPGTRWFRAPRAAQAGSCLAVRIHSAGITVLPRAAPGDTSLVMDSFRESAFLET
jgi:hypothetical protein